MPFKLPSPPSPDANVHEMADFVEFVAWHQSLASARQIVSLHSRTGDNTTNEGCEDDEDDSARKLDDVFVELETRAAECGTAYPFEITDVGDVLKHRGFETTNRPSVVYHFLLLATRLHMTKRHMHAGHDGTKLFELLGSEVLKTYLGSGRAQSITFGTAVTGAFSDRVRDLGKRLGEGLTYQPIDRSGEDANDGKLDAVAWLPFTDTRVGKLIVFGQCKTGTHWHGFTTQCRPRDFADKWFGKSFPVDPVRAFLVAESVDRTKWPSICKDSGLLFDRSRIVECAVTLGDALFQKILDWTIAAKGSTVVTSHSLPVSATRRRGRRSR